VGLGAGLLVYGVYGLTNGGAAALVAGGARIYNGQGTAEDFGSAGEVVGGLVGGLSGPARSVFARGVADGARAGGVPKGLLRPSSGYVAGACGIVGEGAGQLLRAEEELLRQAVGRPPEQLSGFRIFGNKGLVGPTFQRNVLLIEEQTKGAVPIRQLVGAMEAEARAAGATRLSITGHAIVNQGFLNPATAMRYGFMFRLINESTVELEKVLTP